MSEYKYDQIIDKASFDDVISYFVKGYKPKNGKKIYDHEWYLDISKKMIVFVLKTKELIK